MQEQSPRPGVGGRTLLALFVAALAIRIAVLVLHPPADDGDQRLYRILARGLASGAGYVNGDKPETHVHPLLPVLDAVALHAIPDDRTAGMVVTLLIGSLLPVVAAWVVGAAFGRRAALVAAAILALQPHHVLASARLEPDLLGASLGFALSAALIGERWGWAGVVTGLAYLNRPEAVLWLPAAAVYARVRGASVRGLAAMVLAAAALAGPFAFYVHGIEGRWALSGKDRWDYILGVHQYRSGGEPLDPARIPELRREVGSPLQHFKTRPREFVAGYAYRTWILIKNLGRQTGYGLLAPFAVFGLVAGLKKARAATWALLVPLAAVPVLPLVGTFFRHSEVPAAVILALAGVGIARPSAGVDGSS